MLVDVEVFFEDLSGSGGVEVVDEQVDERSTDQNEVVGVQLVDEGRNHKEQELYHGLCEVEGEHEDEYLCEGRLVHVVVVFVHEADEDDAEYEVREVEDQGGSVPVVLLVDACDYG